MAMNHIYRRKLSGSFKIRNTPSTNSSGPQLS